MDTTTITTPSETSLTTTQQEQHSARIPRKEDVLFFPNHTQIHIPGLDYYPSYLSPDEVNRVMEIIDGNTWIKEIRRRQQHYGYVYYHTRHNLPTVQPSEQEKADDRKLPLESFDFLIERMIRDGIFPRDDPPTQCLVNEYLENTRIASHVDNAKAFGDVIAGVSLVSPCYMTMRNCENLNEETRFYMEVGSLYVMKNEARYGWQHGITQMKHFEHPVTGEVTHRDAQYRRVSLTFRKILVEGTKNGENPEHEEELFWSRSKAEEEQDSSDVVVVEREE